jgi:hypothetical protein
MLRAVIRAACVCLLVACVLGQLDTSNKEGTTQPEVAPVSLATAGGAAGVAGPAPTRYHVIAVEGPEGASGSKSRQLDRDLIPSGSDQGESGSSTGGRFSSRDSNQQQAGNSAPGSGNRPKSGLNGQAARPSLAAAPTAVRPSESPAANAPLASATPLLGAAAAGTVIPGRYVVFFHNNVSSLSTGLNR